MATYYTIELQRERNEAIRESKKNEELLNFVTDMFNEADPVYAQGDTLSVYDLLGQAKSRLDTSLTDQPELLAEMIQIMGRIYHGMGDYPSVDSLLQRGFQLLDQHPELQRTNIHAQLMYHQSDLEYSYGKYPEAIAKAQKGLLLAKELSNPGALTCNYYQILGMLALEQVQYASADSFFELALSCYKEGAMFPKEQVANILHFRGDIYGSLGEYDSAQTYFKASLKLKRKIYQPPHIEIAYTLNHLASLSLETGQLDTALVYAQESYRQRKQVLGANHVETVASMGNISRVFSRLGKNDSAIATILNMQKVLNQLFPEAHPFHIAMHSQLGSTYRMIGNYKKAGETYRKGLKVYEELIKSGSESSYRFHGAMMYHGLGLSFMDRNQMVVALPHIQKAWDLYSQLENESTYLSGSLEYCMGKVLLHNRQPEEGKTFLLKAQKIFATQPEMHESFLISIDTLLRSDVF